MSLFKDDFYTAKVPRRILKRNGRRHFSSRSKVLGLFNKTTFQIAAITSITTAIVVTILLAIFVGFNNPSTQATADFSERSILASNKVRPAVVSIVNEQKYSLGLNSKPLDEFSTESGIYKESSVGSGVIVQKDEADAYIVTNYHVVNNAQRIKVVLTTGEEQYAELVGKDKISDIAVIKIPAEGVTEVAQIGDSSALRSAEFVLAMGNPLGMGESTTLGIISVKSEVIGVSLEQFGVVDWEQEVIRVDAAINQGNSGGPLIDMNGHVVGINSMKISDFGVESIGYAIPINNVMPVVNQLIENGYVSRPYLGVYTLNLSQYFEQEAINKELQKRLELEEEQSEEDIEDEDLEVSSELQLPDHVLDGVLIYKVEGPAEKAGLQYNDVIVQLDDVEVKGMLDLRRYLYTKKSVGDKLTIHYYRGKEKKSTTITLTDNNPNL